MLTIDVILQKERYISTVHVQEKLINDTQWTGIDI